MDKKIHKMVSAILGTIKTLDYVFLVCKSPDSKLGPELEYVFDTI